MHCPRYHGRRSDGGMSAWHAGMMDNSSIVPNVQQSWLPRARTLRKAVKRDRFGGGLFASSSCFFWLHESWNLRLAQPLWAILKRWYVSSCGLAFLYPSVVQCLFVQMTYRILNDRVYLGISQSSEDNQVQWRESSPPGIIKLTGNNQVT